MRRPRTTKQHEANEIDLDLFRVIRRIDTFANDHRDEGARQMAMIIDGLRNRIRKHMHPQDQEATS